MNDRTGRPRSMGAVLPLVPRKLLLPLAALALVVALIASQAPTPLAHATPTVTTVVVKPSTISADLSQPTGWTFYSDTTDQPNGAPDGEFVAGPTGATGAGSALLNVGDGVSTREALLTSQFNGTALADLTSLSYSYYGATTNPSNGAYLQFDVILGTNYSSTAYQGRLAFIPASAPNGAWQTVNALSDSGGTWYNSKNIGTCTQSNPCTWTQVLAAYPGASIGNPSGSDGNLVLRIGNGTTTSTAYSVNFDALNVGTSTLAEEFDFEPETQCTTTCYVNATTGNDAFGGDTATSAKKTIAAALAQVSAGGTVSVYPGSYSETTPNVTPASIAGTYTFGLYMGKDNVTLQGVDASGNPITDYNNTVANITTTGNANFGPDGIFVEGDGVTISGLNIGTNSPTTNKTIEVVGDAFTLKNSHISDPGGSVYIDDFRYNSTANTSHVQTYTITGNFFDTATLDVASGPGITNNEASAASSRQIEDNLFQGADRAAISFNSSGSTVPWFTYPVGAATITGNTFKDNTGPQIRLRGDDKGTGANSFQWGSYFDDNTYDMAVVVAQADAGTPTAFNYSSGPYNFPHVIEIDSSLAAAAAHMTSTDKLFVKGSDAPAVTGSETLDSGNTSVSAGNGFDATYSGGGTVYAQLGTYDSNPEADPGSFFSTGSQYFDVFASVLTPAAGATLTVTFPGLTNGQVLRWWDGTAWQMIKSNDGNTPVVASGGSSSTSTDATATVIFGDNSSPKLSELSGTPIVSGDPNAIEVQLVSGASVMTGNTVQVNVVGKATALQGVDFYINYDPAMLSFAPTDCTAAASLLLTLGTGLTPDAKVDYTSIADSGYTDCNGFEYNNTTGRIRISYAQNTTFATGNDILLATITFDGAASSNAVATSISAAAPASAPMFSDNNLQPLTVTILPALQVGGGGALLTGTVQLQGVTDYSGTTVTVTNGTDTYSFTTQADGTFSIAVATPGAYTVSAVHDGYLRAGNASYTVAAGTTALGTVKLLGGDLNGDGSIGLLDLSGLSGDWFHTAPWSITAGTAPSIGPAQTATPDFNGDGDVSILDLSAVAANWGKTIISWP